MIVAIVAVATIPALVEIPVVGMVVETDARHVNAGFGMPTVTFVAASQIGVGGN
jgi:hypothetical protein